MSKRKTYAIYAITKHGVEIAKKIKSSLVDVDLYIANKFMHLAPTDALAFDLPMGPLLKETFADYYCHIHVISVGAVVRMLAPYIVDKKTDPAIICVDDHARFTVCVLSGHVGRGNEFTENIASILNNVPVITTASDVRGTLTVDILGRELGWVLEDMDRNVTRGCAAVVNEEKVAVIQETGDANWWPLDKKLPENVVCLEHFNKISEFDFDMFLIVSDRTNVKDTHYPFWNKGIVYHPKSLVLGLGCDRDASFEVVEKGVYHFLEQEKLSINSVVAIASIDLKKDEPALLQLSKKYHWTFITYSPEVLDAVVGIETPSTVVKKFTGTSSVSEAACLLLSGTNRLVMKKEKFSIEEDGKYMTMAIARKSFARRSE